MAVKWVAMSGCKWRTLKFETTLPNGERVPVKFVEDNPGKMGYYIYKSKTLNGYKTAAFCPEVYNSFICFFEIRAGKEGEEYINLTDTEIISYGVKLAEKRYWHMIELLKLRRLTKIQRSHNKAIKKIRWRIA
jgi:hypothetical protein